MSHFSTVETKMNDLECLLQALDDLGYQYVEDEQGVNVRGYNQQLEKARVAIKVSGKYDVGIKVGVNGIEMIADWWALKPPEASQNNNLFNKSSSATPIIRCSKR